MVVFEKSSLEDKLRWKHHTSALPGPGLFDCFERRTHTNQGMSLCQEAKALS